MTTKTENLRTLHNNLRQGRFDGNIYELLHQFGNEGFVEARQTVETFLDHADSQLRYIALNVLVLHWGMQEYQRTCLRIMKTDPDSDVRRLAARCVGALFGETKSVEALRALLEVIAIEDEEWDVRDAAYASLLEVVGAPRSEWPTEGKLRWPTDINWRRVREAQAIANENGAS